MTYESFNNTKVKFHQIWERAEDNLTELEQLRPIKLDFNSINFNKKIITIPIVTDQLFNIVEDDVQTVLLENFPEWAINMIEVTCIYTMDDAFTSFPIFDGEGEIKDGDLQILKQEFEYWMNNIDENNFNLKIFLSASVTQFKENSQNITVPLSLTLSLKILNQRTYETMNQHKE